MSSLLGMQHKLMSSVILDRRVWLLAGTSALAALLGFYSFTLEQAIGLLRHTGYWFLLGTFLLWVWMLVRVARRRLPSLHYGSADVVGGAVILGAAWLLTVHEPNGFKILMDEANLYGTSVAMHLEREVVLPTRGHDITGSFTFVEGLVDKRPPFFPFLVSLVHDLAGPREANVVAINHALLLAFLVLLYLVGRRLAGRLAAVGCVLLVPTLALFAQAANGGGFELLNVVLILLAVGLAGDWLEDGHRDSLSALVLTGVLLALTRYESVLFVPAVAGAALLGWWRRGRVLITPALVAAPLLLVPYAWCNAVFRLRPTSWELESKPGYDAVFSLQHIPENLGHALNFFFDFTTSRPNSPLLAAGGMAACLVMLLFGLRWLRRQTQPSPQEAAFLIFAVSFAANVGLLLAYFWGKFDDPVIARLSLPLHLGFLLAIAAALGRVPAARTPAASWAAITCAALALVALGIPTLARHAYTRSYIHSEEIAWRRDLMERLPEVRRLMVDHYCIWWVANRQSATPPDAAASHPERIAFHLRGRSFQEVLVFQTFDVDPDTGELDLREAFDVGAAFELEPIEERRLEYLTLSRVSRIVGVRGESVDPAPDLPPLPEEPTPTERTRRRAAFVEEWLRQLP